MIRMCVIITFVSGCAKPSMEHRKWCIIFVLFSVTAISLSKEPWSTHADRAEVISITFLIDVNNTYKHIPPFDNTTYTCVTTVKTDPIYPDTSHNKTRKIVMGNCDNGSLVFNIRSDVKGNTVVVPTLSSTFVGFSHTCSIDWNYRYRLPNQTIGAEESLLPGCFTTNTMGPEEIEVVSYWFYILDWDISTEGQSMQHQDQDLEIKNLLSVVSVTFLVAVNQTERQCLMTSKTAPLQPGKVHNQTEYIHVGKCDYGALDFNITTSMDAKGKSHTYIDLVFHSHDIEDASPPTCKILWDYSYKIPSDDNYKSSLLPGCYTSESREGFHVTYYWFYVLDWMHG